MLPAFRAVEHHPHRKIVGERLKAVFDMSRNEERVSRFERHGFSGADKSFISGGDHIDLVPRVGCLGIAALGGVV